MIRLFPILFTAMLPLMAWQQPQVTEEYRVNLVELEVKATTVGGKFIGGLSPEDFVVKENGKVVDVASIEEVRIGKLSEEEAAAHRSRIMLMLDFQNTSVPMMHRTFPKIREFIDTLYVGRHEVGLAINTRGVVELVPFTRNREALLRGVDQAEQIFKKSRHRSRGVPFSGRNTQRNEEYVQYFRQQTHVLGQFIHYLGAWSGKKNLIVISEQWIGTDFPTDTSSENEYMLSIKDIQTACLDHKITVNALTLSRGSERLSNGGMIDLASLTAGFNLRTSYRELDDFVENIIHKMEHYYLVRYYSEYDSPRFRNIKVSVKGATKMARSLGGYFPKSKGIDPQEADATVAFARNHSSVLALGTDWMTWERGGFMGFSRRSLHYAVAQRVYDTDGNMLMEKVTPGQLARVKENGDWIEPQFNENLNLGHLNHDGPVQIETIVMDLNSGRFVRMQADPDGWDMDENTKI